jgi:hypothetical protein
VFKSTGPTAWRRWLCGAAIFGTLAAGVLATTVVPPDFEQMVNGSDYIVRARVKSVSTEIRTRNGFERIYTKVELQVLEVIAGTPPSPLVLTMLGGKSGQKEMIVEGAPKFIVGNEDILFVQGNGTAITPLYAMMHGQYPVLHDTAKGRTYITRSNLVPLLSTAEVSQPMAEGAPAELLRRLVNPAQALTPAQFIQSIKATRHADTPARANAPN